MGWFSKGINGELILHKHQKQVERTTEATTFLPGQCRLVTLISGTVCHSFILVKRESFLPTVPKCLPIEGQLIVGSFLCITMGFLLCNMKRLEATVAMIWRYMNKIKMKWNWTRQAAWLGQKWETLLSLVMTGDFKLLKWTKCCYSDNNEVKRWARHLNTKSIQIPRLKSESLGPLLSYTHYLTVTTCWLNCIYSKSNRTSRKYIQLWRLTDMIASN